MISVSSYITFRKMYRQSTDEMNRKTLRATVEFYEEKIFQPVMKIYSDFLGASGIGKTGNLFYSERQLDTMEIYEINNSIRSEAAKNEFISEIHLYNSRRQQMISSRFGYKSGEDIEKILKNYYSIDDQWLDQVKFYRLSLSPSAILMMLPGITILFIPSFNGKKVNRHTRNLLFFHHEWRQHL